MELGLLCPQLQDVSLPLPKHVLASPGHFCSRELQISCLTEEKAVPRTLMELLNGHLQMVLAQSCRTNLSFHYQPGSSASLPATGFSILEPVVWTRTMCFKSQLDKHLTEGV